MAVFDCEISPGEVSEEHPMKVSACRACGAPVHPIAEKCSYCGQYLLSESGKPINQETAHAGLLFHRQPEPNENACYMI
jgi:ribosomal protein L40E